MPSSFLLLMEVKGIGARAAMEDIVTENEETVPTTMVEKYF